MSGLRLRTFLPTVFPSPLKHSASIIFCHGFGATASDWQDLHRLPGLAHVKIILPQAPLRAISINSMQPMPAWFDILSVSHSARTQDGDEDEEGIAESLEDLLQLVQAEIQAGIDPRRIVIGGFSQGAAMALLLGVTGQIRLGGVIALSGYLPLQWKFVNMLSSHARELPLFMAHGTADNVIPLAIGEAGVDALRSGGIKDIEFRTYSGMAHGACNDELQDLTRWLQRMLPALDDGEGVEADEASQRGPAAKL